MHFRTAGTPRAPYRAACTRGLARIVVDFKVGASLAYDRMPSNRTGLRADRKNMPSRSCRLGVLLVAFAVGCGVVAAPRPEPPASATDEPFLLLRLNERRLYLMDHGAKQPPQGYPVAIGRPKYPTPTGHFQVNEMVRNPDFLAFDFEHPEGHDRGHVPPGPNNPLGLRWIGFASAHGWQVGFHGTAKTSVLGQAVSHGCVRMSNADVVEVFNHVKVGTVVVVEP